MKNKNYKPIVLELLEALDNLTATARTFRNVPKDEQEWTSIDDIALDCAFKTVEKAEKLLNKK